MAYETLILTHRDAVATITLNRPTLNVVTPTLLQELLAVKPQAWRKELGDIRQYLAEFGSRTPGTLYNELEEVEERLG